MGKWSSPEVAVLDLGKTSVQTTYYVTEDIYMEFPGVKPYYYLDKFGKRMYVDSIPENAEDALS